MSLWLGALGGQVTAVPPGVPTNLTATTGYKYIDLAWTAPVFTAGGVTDYIIQSSSDNSNWSTISDDVSTAVTYRVSGLNDGQTVFFRVAAVSSGVSGDFTSSVSTTTLTPKATGGEITYVAPNFIHTYTYAFTGGGSMPFTPLVPINNINALIVAGGRNGASGSSSSSGAGGSGGYARTVTFNLSTPAGVRAGEGGLTNGTSRISNNTLPENGLLEASGPAYNNGSGRSSNGPGLNGGGGLTSSISGTTVTYGSGGGGGGFSNTTTTQSGGIGGTGAGNGGRGRSVSTSPGGSSATTPGSGGGGQGGRYLSGGGPGKGQPGIVIISYQA